MEHLPATLSKSDVPAVLPEETGEAGILAIRKKFFGHYEFVSTEDLLAEYDERIRVFREYGRHGEVRILNEGKRTWAELRSKIGEARFREELIMTLSLAFHASFLIVPPLASS